MKALIVAALVMLALSVGAAEAATINAASCERAAVEKAFDRAANRDTVTIPAGSCTWPSVLFLGKHITVQCAGRTLTTITASGSATNSPILLNVSVASGGTIRITGCKFQASGNLRPNNILVQAGGQGQIRIDNNHFNHHLTRGIQVLNGVTGVIDHNLFDMGCYGCFSLVNRSGSDWDVSSPIKCLGGNVGCGDRSWSQPVVRGDMIHVEDNAFVKAANVAGIPQGWIANHDGDFGMRGVYRNNVWTNGRWGDHGTDTDGRPRGDRYSEHYRDIFTYDSNSSQWLRGLSGLKSTRGGSHRMFDNVVVINGSGIPNALFSMISLRSDDGNGQWRTWRTWGRCGTKNVSFTRDGTAAVGTFGSRSGSMSICSEGTWIRITGAGAPFDGTFFATNPQQVCIGGTVDNTFNFTVANSGPASGSGQAKSAYDGNADATGHVCFDGPGAGQTEDFSGSIIPPVPTRAPTLEPNYIWNNRVDNNTDATTNLVLNAGVYANSGQVPAAVLCNREYYNQNASFNGAATVADCSTGGVGRGLRAARPATCTTGVAYWSTNGGGNWNQETTADHAAHDPNDLTHTEGEDGGLDLCVSTDNWDDDWYVPSDYPHDLVTGGRRAGPGGNGAQTGDFRGVVRTNGVMDVVQLLELALGLSTTDYPNSCSRPVCSPGVRFGRLDGWRKLPVWHHGWR